MEIIRDIICQVYAGEKSRDSIELVLETFIPEYEKLNLDFCTKPNDPDYQFKSEDEMIDFFINSENVDQTFYWNKLHENPDKLMIGAHITSDDKLIISLTFDGTKETEKFYLENTLRLLNSKASIVSYVNPAEYESGQDFVQKFGS